MSVVVKGMKLPDMCGHCRFATAFDCEATGKFIVDHNERNANCPLVEISEPHGRLIDADKLKETLDYYIREAGWNDEINKALSWVKDDFIDAEPTVIPASGEED